MYNQYFVSINNHIPPVLICHEGHHDILDGIEDLDDVFGIADEKPHHHGHTHDKETAHKDSEKKHSFFRKHHHDN